ncbi:MAG: rod shape-determining protein MreC [Cellulosilyticaceae bacterium]
MKLANKIKIKKKHLITVGVIVIGITTAIIVGKNYNMGLLSVAVDTVTYPFEKSINFVSGKLGNVSKYFANVKGLALESEKLKEDNDRLLYENTILQQYKAENEQLKGLLEISQRYSDYPSKGANIISNESSNWYKEFSIDKGSKDGLKINDVILASGGLVGHVTNVQPLSSTVIGIIDDRSSVPAKVVRTGDVGIVRGDIELMNKGMVKLELDIESEVVKGDQIITSHLSEIYPTGVPIGIVEEVTTGKNGLIQYAYIKPFVDFKHLEDVLVVMNDQKE